MHTRSTRGGSTGAERHHRGAAPTWRLRVLSALLMALALTTTAGVSWAKDAPRAKAAGDPLVVGTWKLGEKPVVDGDTLRIPDERSVRILGIDTEETFKEEQDRALCEAGFEAYAKAKRGNSKRPVKFGTPLGEAATAFGRKLLEGATGVRLERDEPAGRDFDIYGRRLAYVIVLKPSGEVNWSEAMIRQGYSPYFVKYGRSRRFDLRFREAEAEAKKHKRGIFAEPGQGPHHYLDYDERFAWWHARANQVESWRKHMHLADRVTLGDRGALDKARKLVGKPIIAFGLLDRVVETRDGQRLVLFFAHERGRGFPVVLLDTSLIKKLDMPTLESMYTFIRGTVTLYRGRPQIILEKPDQLATK